MKLLIVEDYLLVAWALRALISELDPRYRIVGIATNPTKALYLARECGPDLALVDIRLENNTSGIDVARQLSGLNIRSVYVTAYRGDAEAMPGVLGCLLKPFNQDDIRQVLLAAEAIMNGREPGFLPSSFIRF